MGIASTIGVWEGAYKETMWVVAMGWGGFMTYFFGIWFHEFWVGGPHEPDSIFDDFILTGYIAFGGLTALVIANLKTAYPMTFTSNLLACVFGFWVMGKIDVLHLQEHPSTKAVEDLTTTEVDNIDPFSE